MDAGIMPLQSSIIL